MTIECQMGRRSRGPGQKLHRRGLNRRLTKGASTYHFFSFITAIDQGMTSVNQPRCLDPGINVFKPTVTSWSQRQHLKPQPRPLATTATFRTQPDVSNPVPMPRNQPAATSRNQPIHVELSTNILKSTSLNPTSTCLNSYPMSIRRTRGYALGWQFSWANANILNPMPTCRPCLSPFLGISASRNISVSILSLYFFIFC